MPWGQWARKPARSAAAACGLDFNSGRVRGSIGLPGQPTRALTFAAGEEELPAALHLDTRPITVGSSALKLRRQSPHQLCDNFLPYLGQARTWSSGRHKVDSKAALTFLAERLRTSLANSSGFVAVWPAYLDPTQIALGNDVLDAVKALHLGSVTLPLAVAIASGKSRKGTGLVLDADDHAVTWSVVTVDSRQVRHHGSLPRPGIGIRAWVDRLMHLVADRCIQLCRRDPRDSALAEQSLDDQLSATLSQPRTDRPWPLSIRTEHWLQNMMFSAEEADRGCINLANTAAEAVSLALAEWPVNGPPDFLWATSAAARLPGLLQAVSARLPQRTAAEELPAGAVAEAAQNLALRRLRGELSAGHIDGVLPRETVAAERIHTR